jgi:hypothetical protein
MKIPKAGDVGMDMWNRNGKHVKMYFAILGNVKIHKNSYKADILREDGLIIKDCNFFPSDKFYSLLESC